MAVETAILFREAGDADLPACAQLWLEMFEEVGKYKSADFVPDWRARFVDYASRRIKAGELRYFIAVMDGEIVASAGALLRDGYPAVITGVRQGYVFGVSVKPHARKRGLATALTQHCVEWLKAQNVSRLQLHASPFGRPIYEKMGFIPSNEMSLPL